VDHKQTLEPLPIEEMLPIKDMGQRQRERGLLFGAKVKGLVFIDEPFGDEQWGEGPELLIKIRPWEDKRTTHLSEANTRRWIEIGCHLIATIVMRAKRGGGGEGGGEEGRRTANQK
jgi:hypothetical protein